MTTNHAVSDSKAETDDAANQMETRIKDAAGGITNAENQFGEKADEAAQYAAQAYHGAKRIAEENLGDVERQIRQRPVQAALLAAGFGLLIAMLITRGSRHSHVRSGFESPSRWRIRMTRRRLRDELNNQIARAEHAWDSIHGSDRVRDIGRYLGAQRHRWLS
jgi:hypothetical protein